MINGSLSERMWILRGPTNCETALSGITSLPASAAFIDVSGYEFAHIIAHLGTIHASDSPVLTPKCSDSASGTLDVIDSTLAHTPAVDDDGEFVSWSIEVRKLPLDHHFIALAFSGTLTNGSYADVVFLLERGAQPVTQATAQLPTASQYHWLG